jgi:hypothetical protein
MTIYVTLNEVKGLLMPITEKLVLMKDSLAMNHSYQQENSSEH